MRIGFLSPLVNERLQSNLFTRSEKWDNQFEGKLYILSSSYSAARINDL